MELTIKQEAGLQIAMRRFKERKPYTCIAGFAGTGKTTLVNFIISGAQVNPNYVAYIAYTGKASLVLRKKNCPNAQTAHKLLYNSFIRNDGTFFHRPKSQLDYPYKIIVVDEISMLPKTMWDLLLSHNVHVIALGDVGQLPPIGEDNKVLTKPHVFLDEVVRQAKDSEIIRLTMDIRNGTALRVSSGDEVKIIKAKEANSGMYLWADQIIAAKNATRHAINRQVRGFLDLDLDKVNEGEKIICLKNDWDTINAAGQPLVNGLIGYARNPVLKKDLFIESKWQFDFNELLEDHEDYDKMSDYLSIVGDAKLFATGEPTINSDNYNSFPYLIRKRLRLFDYGYCITCHKSQGSEYDKVVVLNEYMGNTDHKKWLYTAATRAAKKLVILI